MKKKRMFFKVNLTFLLSILFIGFLDLVSQGLVAQATYSNQWKKAGGTEILSGNHHFTTSWSSSSDSREKGLYWQGSFYESAPKFVPFEPTVRNSVALVKGQITVLGPGHVGLYEKTKGGGSIVMYDAKTKAVFHPCHCPNHDFNPDGEFWGRIPAGKEVTIIVEAHMSAYNNMMNTGEYAFHAPQEITNYEVWFFPGDGGKVISVHQSGHVDKPKPGILYYTEKGCN